MRSNTIELEYNKSIATLWLNQPDKGNALSLEMAREITLALDSLVKNHCRLLIIRGRGKHFCTGADLAEMRSSAKADFDSNKKDAIALSDMFQRLQHLPIPVVAVVHGAVYGGASGLVCCADIAIGIRSTETPINFCFSEVKLGLAPAIISGYVINAIGLRQVRRYFLSAENINQDTALKIGLLHQLIHHEELDYFIKSMGEKFQKNSPQAMAACKLLLENSKYYNHQEYTRASTELIARLRASPEGLEGINAFFEKRPPHWI